MSYTTKKFKTDLAPTGYLTYRYYLPPGFGEENKFSKKLPLLLCLHGGGGNETYCDNVSKTILMREKYRSKRWTSPLPPMCIVAPATNEMANGTRGRLFWANAKDKPNQQIETLLVTTFLSHLRKTLPIKKSRDDTFIYGSSMGGMGGLRLAFKHPHLFHAVSVMEPAIEPVKNWKDVMPFFRKHNINYRPVELMETFFGKPIDEEFYKENNVLAIVEKNGQLIKESGLRIYFEVGNMDDFGLYFGADALHRELFDLNILHEFKLVDKGRHVSTHMLHRSMDSFNFLARVLDPVYNNDNNNMSNTVQLLQAAQTKKEELNIQNNNQSNTDSRL